MYYLSSNLGASHFKWESSISVCSSIYHQMGEVSAQDGNLSTQIGGEIEGVVLPPNQRPSGHLYSLNG